MSLLAESAKRLGSVNGHLWYVERLQKVDLRRCLLLVEIRCGVRAERPCGKVMGMVRQSPYGPMFVRTGRRDLATRAPELFTHASEGVRPRRTQRQDFRCLINEERTNAPWNDEGQTGAQWYEDELEAGCSEHGRVPIAELPLTDACTKALKRWEKATVWWPPRM
jgi:hypothetical protein